MYVHTKDLHECPSSPKPGHSLNCTNRWKDKLQCFPGMGFSGPDSWAPRVGLQAACQQEHGCDSIVGSARTRQPCCSNRQQDCARSRPGARRPGACGGEASRASVLFVPRPLCSVSQAHQLIRCHLDTYCFLGINCTSVTLIDNCLLYGFQTLLGNTMKQSIHISVYLRASHFRPARKQPLSLSSEKCQEETSLGGLTTNFQQSLKVVQPVTLETSPNS